MRDRALSRRARGARIAGAAVILGGPAALAIFPRLSLGMCPFGVLTGLPCPLCGGTRAAKALLHGDWGLALYFNPLAIIAALALALALAMLIWEAARGRALADWARQGERAARLLPWGALLLLVWWPFHLGVALARPKPELLNLQNPAARSAYGYFHPMAFSSARR